MIVALAVVVHPLRSVTVVVYVPVDKPFLFCVVMPPPQLYVYGRVPPLAVNVMVPLLPPLQLIFVLVIVALRAVAG